MNWPDPFTIANFVVLIGTIIGGYIVIRSTIAKMESGVQKRVQEALSAENELLNNRVARLEKDNRRLERLIQLIITTLKKKYRIELEIADDTITLRTQSGSHTAQINSTDASA